MVEEKIYGKKVLEVWTNTVEMYGCPPGSWVWKVLSYNRFKGTENPDTRWMCQVTSPMAPSGDMGDVWVNSQLLPFAKRIR